MSDVITLAPPRRTKRERDFERVVNEFKSDAGTIEEAPTPIHAHIALYVILTLLLVAILWSIIGTVDRIVVAPGRTETRAPTLVMQPFATSRIIQIDVRPGDHVRKGQALVRFDPAFAQADVASLQQKVTVLTAQTQRLDAELRGLPYRASSGDGAERITQAQIYAQEMSDYEAEVTARDSRLGQIAAQLRMDDESLPGLNDQLQMAQALVDIQRQLQNQKAAAPLDVMRARNSAIDSQLHVTETVGDRNKMTSQRAEQEQERKAYIQKWQSDHNQQLVDARQQLAESVETLHKAQRLNDFTALVAPADGIVQAVADRSVGSVVREAETLVTLVPDGTDLYVEANVDSRDISYLDTGDLVRVKLESYPFQRFGTLTGVLEMVSPDSAPVDAEHNASKLVYHARVRLQDNAASLAERGILLRPGLVASAEIKTGKRSIASYILNPVLKIADESMREP